MKPEGSLQYSQQPAAYPYFQPDRFKPYPHSTSRRSILILSSYLSLSLPSALLPSGFPTKTLYAPLPHTCYMPCSSQSFWLHHPNNISWGVQSTKLLAIYSFSLFCHLVVLRGKYTPRPPVLENPHPTLLAQCVQSTVMLKGFQLCPQSVFMLFL